MDNRLYHNKNLRDQFLGKRFIQTTKIVIIKRTIKNPHFLFDFVINSRISKPGSCTREPVGAIPKKKTFVTEICT